MFAMPTAAGIDALAEMWAGVMLRSSIDSAVLLAVLMAFWLPLRRRCSNQLTIGLFLLVFLKLALPVPLSLPEQWARFWPSTYLSVRTVAATAGDMAPASKVAASAAAVDEASGRRTASHRASGSAFLGIGATKPSLVPVSAESIQPMNPATPMRIAAQRPIPTTLSRAAWLMLAWAGIVASLLARLMLQQVRFSRRLRRARPIELASLLLDWHALVGQVGMKSRIPLLETDQVSAPAVFGLLRPRVLVPPGLTSRLATGPLAWVLLHELIHIRRGDLWVRAFQQLVQTAYFFHPAAWIAGRIVDLYREYACDDTALAACRETSRAECGRGLIAVVEEARSCRSIAPGATLGLFGSRDFLRSRILRILDTRRVLAVRATVPAALLLVGTALASLPYVRAQVKPVSPTREAASTDRAKSPIGVSHPMELSVIDAKTGKPEPAVTVRIEDRGGNSTAQGRTDRDGKYVVPASALLLGQLRLHIEKAGFVPVSVGWNGPDSLVSVEIPTRHLVALDRGTTIGGLVQDQDGKAIEGASIEVSLSYSWGQNGIPAVDLRYLTRSDASGKWTCDMAPREFKAINVKVSHPGCDPKNYPQRVSSERLAILTALQERTVLTRHNSNPVEGKVSDSAGRPVANAIVRWGDSQVATDADGRFSLDHFAVGAEPIWVQADGYLPSSRHVGALEIALPVGIVLEWGRIISGKVVDHKNRPVSGARILFDGGFSGDIISGPQGSDAEGKFRLTVPVNSPGLLRVRHGMFNEATVSFKASDREVAVTLPSYAIAVHVRAVDAETNNPIPKFHVLTRGTETFRHAASDGQFTHRWPNWRLGNLYVRVEAADYATSAPQVARPGSEEVELVFRMRKMPAINAIVRDADGRPVRDAEYVVAIDRPQEYFEDRYGFEGPHITANHSPFAPMKTDGTGRIAFSDMEEPVVLLVAHPSGFVRQNIDRLRSGEGKPVDVRLRPWGRVEGVVVHDGRPVPEASVSLDVIKDETPMSGYRRYVPTTVDAQGRFVFDHLPPCWVKLSYSLTRRAPGFQVGKWIPAVELGPGQVVRPVLGGEGRPVVGRLALPPELKDASRANHRAGFLTGDSPGSTRPEGVSREELERTRFEDEKARVVHSFTIASDGTFRVDNVEAAKYELVADMCKINSGGSILERFGDAKRTIVVPAVDGRIGNPAGPFDLGVIPFETLPKARVGDPMPDEPLRSLDRKQVRFSDFRGKYLALVFWDTQDRTTRSDSEAFRRLHERFRRLDRFAMLGVCLGASSREPGVSLVRQRGWDWPQAHLERPDGRFQYECKLDDLPSVWLIGPDGKVLARDLRGEAIGEAVVKELARK